MSSLIRAATLKNYFEVAQQLDLNPQPLLQAAGLSRTMLADPERRIPAVAAVRLLEDSARASAAATPSACAWPSRGSCRTSAWSACC